MYNIKIPDLNHNFRNTFLFISYIFNKIEEEKEEEINKQGKMLKMDSLSTKVDSGRVQSCKTFRLFFHLKKRKIFVFFNRKFISLKRKYYYFEIALLKTSRVW